MINIGSTTGTYISVYRDANGHTPGSTGERWRRETHRERYRQSGREGGREKSEERRVERQRGVERERKEGIYMWRGQTGGTENVKRT